MSLSDRPIGELIDDLYTTVEAEICYEMRPPDERSAAKTARFYAKSQDIVDALSDRVRDTQIVARLRGAITNHERALANLGRLRNRPNWVTLQTAKEVIDATRFVVYADIIINSYASCGCPDHPQGVRGDEQLDTF